MHRKTLDLALLKRAQKGHAESLCVLSEWVRRDMNTYLRRLILDDHVADDLCQETIVQMLKSLPKLRLDSVKAFWAWTYKTAFSRVSHHYRDQGKNRVQKRSVSDDRVLRQIPTSVPSGPQALMRKELSSAIYEAMDSLKLKYRHVLTLRCFQDLSYAEIAGIIGGSELQARLRFFRAKRSLRQQLASRGIKRETHLLAALSVFASLTLDQPKATAASSLVKASTLKISAGTLLLGTASTKIGAAALVVATTSLIVVGAGLNPFPPQRTAPQPLFGGVKNLDTTLLDLLQRPEFQCPQSIGKYKPLRWTDRSQKTPSHPKANVAELLLNKAEQDLRVVILPKDRWIRLLYTGPIVDGPGADIVIAGWTAPPPLLEVRVSQDQYHPLSNPTDLRDTWNRHLFGYDLGQLATPIPVQEIRITSTHNQGPHQGFELHEIRARQE